MRSPAQYLVRLRSTNTSRHDSGALLLSREPPLAAAAAAESHAFDKNHDKHTNAMLACSHMRSCSLLIAHCSSYLRILQCCKVCAVSVCPMPNTHSSVHDVERYPGWQKLPVTMQ